MNPQLGVRERERERAGNTQRGREVEEERKGWGI